MKKSASALRNRSGLTLIEILIVTGLVSMLTYVLTTLMVNSTRQAQSVSAKTEFNDLVNTMQSLFNNSENCKSALSGVKLKKNTADFPQPISMKMGGKTLAADIQYGALKITKFQFNGSTSLTAANQYLVPLYIEVNRGQGGATAVGGNVLFNEFELAITVGPSAPMDTDAPIIGCAGKFNNQWTGVTGGIAYKGGKVGIGPGFGDGTPEVVPMYPLDITGTVRAGAFIYNSDRRLKENIREIPDALDRVLRLHGVLYDWKARPDSSGERDRLGFLAQEVEQVFPEAVETDPKTGLKSVAYGNLISPLIEAMKEQQEMIRQQSRELEELRSTLRKKTGLVHGR
jgi:type II secretory pathway pseudopilin PulG